MKQFMTETEILDLIKNFPDVFKIIPFIHLSKLHNHFNVSFEITSTKEPKLIPDHYFICTQRDKNTPKAFKSIQSVRNFINHLLILDKPKQLSFKIEL